MHRDAWGWWFGAASMLAAACSSQSATTPPALSDGGLTTEASDAGLTIAAGGPVGTCADPALLDAGAPEFYATGCPHAVDAGVELAVFSWANRTGQTQSVPYGSLNQVSPGAAAQGQSESFAIGATGMFAVPLAASPVTWTILGRTVTVSAGSADCAGTCVGMQLAGPDSYQVDACTTACGDGTCDKTESCQTCPADCDCTSLEPLVDCVSIDASGKRHASFGYRNTAMLGAGIAVGPQNHLAPGDDAQSQPVFFPPGEQHGVFNVTYSSAAPTWTLGSSAVTATDGAPTCPQTCTGDCGQGAVCVGATCQASCGDGWCDGEEDCNSCAADCGCGEQVCYHGGCAGLPQCGEEGPECGSIDSFGVHLDCGPCPDGLACLANNVCAPLCSADGGA
jgi:hypothetical protein